MKKVLILGALGLLSLASCSTYTKVRDGYDSEFIGRATQKTEIIYFLCVLHHKPIYREKMSGDYFVFDKQGEKKYCTLEGNQVFHDYLNDARDGKGMYINRGPLYRYVPGEGNKVRQGTYGLGDGRFPDCIGSNIATDTTFTRL